MSKNHDELAHSLALHLAKNDARMVWEDIPAGKAGSIRPDVFTLNKSFANPMPTTYEVKISVSDFRADVTSAKWMGYLGFSEAVVFAVPAGLITKKDIPHHCGLMVCNDGIWRTVKKPTYNKNHSLDPEFLLKLLIGGKERMSGQISCKPREASEWILADKVRKKLGKEFAEKIARIDQLDRFDKKVTQAKIDLCNALGLDPLNTDDWVIYREISQTIKKLQITERQAAINIAKELKNAGEMLIQRHDRLLSSS